MVDMSEEEYIGFVHLNQMECSADTGSCRLCSSVAHRSPAKFPFIPGAPAAGKLVS